MRRRLAQLGVTIQDGTTVTVVKSDELETDAGSIPFDVCLWAGGFTVPALARESGLAVNERGQILIDPTMRSISHPAIMAIGDAAYPLEEHGVKVRMSAFAAMLMGAHGADALSAVLQGRTPPPFHFAYLGQGIALGRHDAIGFGLQPDDKPRAAFFTGRVGYEGREFFVRLLANAPRLERIWLNALLWEVRFRYARAQRQFPQQIGPLSDRHKWGGI
jgi:NADH dehydrogenase FAD-containing subunit